MSGNPPARTCLSIPALAVAAGATKRIRLLSTIVLLPIYPPVILAKLVADLDLASNGRYICAVGVGGEQVDEFRAAGIPVNERGRRGNEILTLLIKLWTEQNVTFKGRYYNVDDVTLNPPPLQKPHPPIWVGGRKDAAMRRAARFGTGWMPYFYSPERYKDSVVKIKRYAAEEGRTLNGFEWAHHQHVILGDSKKEAFQKAVASFGYSSGRSSEKLAQDVTRGMREAASRGFWMSSEAPLGYNRMMVQDGPKKRPKLEPDPDSSHVVRRMFDMSEAGKSTLDIARILNDEGITSPRGKPWGKTTVHAILINETYTGTLTWGVNAKDGADPVRVENAFPAIISTAQFNRVSKLLRSRAPRIVNPRRVASPFLLSGLVKCKTCRRALTGQCSKYAQFTYYVCQTLMKRGKGSCDAPRLNARRFEELVVDKIRFNIFTEGNVPDLVKAVDEEIDSMVAEDYKRVQTIEVELQDVKKQLDRIWRYIATRDDVDAAKTSARMAEYQDRQDRLEDGGGERKRGAGPAQVSFGQRRRNCGIRQRDGRLPG